MKLMNLACAMLVVACMASCTAESDEPVNYDEITFSLEKTYNARSVNYVEGSKNTPNLSELPPVTVEEVKRILSTLRAQEDLSENHSLETQEGEPGQRFLTISTECNVGKQHKLTMQLSMITYEDDGSLYYKDCNAFASSSLYKWHLTGFGLSSTEVGNMYKFNCSSYLYFKVAGEEISYIQVPVKVNGKYNSSSHEVNFTYSL